LLFGIPLLALGMASTASAAAPPTLTGEVFDQDRPAITWADCREQITFGYVATGQAAGPYPGPFVETGTVGDFQVRATFTIDSPAGKVTGTKTAPVGRSCVTDFFCSGVADCERASVGYNTNPGVFDTANPYEATIRTAAGLFSDRGLFQSSLYHTTEGNLPFDGFDSSFQSDLQAPVQLFPRTNADCVNGGWRSYGVFKNQGQCVSFVATGGKNPPAGR
jgi:hypothetical protein